MTNLTKKFLTITGKPGSGKSTIIHRILKEREDCLRIFAGKSYITREPRANDVPGEYRYVNDTEFKGLAEDNKFIWSFELPAKPHAYRVGTLRSSIDVALSRPFVSVMTLVPQAVAMLQQQVGPERVISFFIETPERDEAERMAERGDSKAAARKRLLGATKWTPSLMTELGIEFICVQNPREEPKGESAVRAILEVLRGIDLG